MRQANLGLDLTTCKHQFTELSRAFIAVKRQYIWQVTDIPAVSRAIGHCARANFKRRNDTLYDFLLAQGMTVLYRLLVRLACLWGRQACRVSRHPLFRVSKSE